MWSWCVCGGLLNGLNQNFDLYSGSLLKWHSLLSWSYGLWWFKEVRNGVRGLVCVIPRCARLSSSDAWLQGSIGILATSLGFARCFCKPSSISQVNFAIWRPFWSLKVISQPFQSLEIISQPFRNLEIISQQSGIFADHFTTAKWGYGCCEVALMCQMVVSQL